MLDPHRPWTEHRLVVADVEGDGRRPPGLVELGLVPIVEGRPGDPVSWLVRPPHGIGWQATRVHGITTADVAELPGIDAVADDIRAHLDHAVLVAHHASVDLDVLIRALPGWQPPAVVDTLRLARRLLPGRPRYRLGDLVDALHLDQDLPPGLRPHRASYDAVVTARLLLHLAALAGDHRLPLVGLLTAPPPASDPHTLF